MKRSELQRGAVNLIKTHNRLILEWCTGLGKSKAAIDIVKELIPDTVLLVIAEVAHRSNWVAEFNKFDAEGLLPRVQFTTYASLKNYRDQQFDLLILDEAHHSGSDLRLDILKDIHANKILLLSATLPEATISSLEEIYGEFKVNKVTLKQGIEEGILNEPKIYIIPLTLDDHKGSQTVTIEWGNRNKRVTMDTTWENRWFYLKNKLLYPNMQLNIKCTEQQKYKYLDEQSEYYKKRYFMLQNEAMKNKWLQTGLKRKRFLGDIKTREAERLLRKLRGKKFICFCSSILQAEVLGGKNAIHSEKGDSLEVIDKFNKGEIKELYAVGMLQEGQNLKGIEAGVIIQLDGAERAFIQKSGRAMRAEDPILFIMYYKNTRDAEYLEKVLEGIDEKYITIIENIKELEI